MNKKRRLRRVAVWVVVFFSCIGLVDTALGITNGIRGGFGVSDPLGAVISSAKSDTGDGNGKIVDKPLKPTTTIQQVLEVQYLGAAARFEPEYEWPCNEPSGGLESQSIIIHYCFSAGYVYFDSAKTGESWNSADTDQQAWRMVGNLTAELYAFQLGQSQQFQPVVTEPWYRRLANSTESHDS
jgi:hypothetical protein